ncbi:MAG: FAD binding domain-containing protein [Solirubrobacterales bacterium]
MRPAPFEYVAPSTVEEALQQVEQHGDEAKLLAGGQSLVPLLNFRFAAPTVLIDLNAIEGLGSMSVGDELVVDAMVRQRDVETADDVQAALPVLGETLGHVGHVAIRSRGTIAGSVAHADPAAELPALLLALDGTVVATGPAGSREIAARDFFVSIFTTALEPDEMITSVRIPCAPGGAAVEEVARRHGDFALAGAVAQVETDPNGTISGARLALFGVDATPVRADAAEELLIGENPEDAAVLEAAGRAAADGVSPVDDAQVPASYKKRITGVVARRAVARAAARSKSA